MAVRLSSYDNMGAWYAHSFHAEWNGQRFEQWGRVIAFNPRVSLKYSLFAPRPDLTDSPENYFFMTIDSKTEMERLCWRLLKTIHDQ